MAKFPRVYRPCPYKSKLSKHMDGDMCRLCDRQVHNLSAMNEKQRTDFVSGCKEEVCVSYRLPVSQMVGAAAAATAMIASPAMAQDQQTQQDTPTETVEDLEDWDDMLIIVGAIKTGDDAEYIDSEEDEEIPEAPVIYEDEDGNATVSETE